MRNSTLLKLKTSALQKLLRKWEETIGWEKIFTNCIPVKENKQTNKLEVGIEVWPFITGETDESLNICTNLNS